MNESEERERLEQELESLAQELDKKAEIEKDRYSINLFLELIKYNL